MDLHLGFGRRGSACTCDNVDCYDELTSCYVYGGTTGDEDEDYKKTSFLSIYILLLIPILDSNLYSCSPNHTESRYVSHGYTEYFRLV